MKIFTCIENLGQHLQIFMALGTFDGVHLGHQKIIAQTVKQAKTAGGISAVFTFSNHPLAVIDPERCPPLIITNQEKIEQIEALEVDMLFNIPFTPELLQLSPEGFVQLIADNLCLQHVIVGANFTYGHCGAGNADTLTLAGQKHGFTVGIYNMVDVDGIVVSSTAIRQLVNDGAVKQAAKLLSRPFAITGQVIKGDQRGRQLGFPTANLDIPEGFLVPVDGVYAVYAINNGIKYKGLANIGDNPTFTWQKRRIEVHIIDFTGDLYNHTLKVEFIDRIRSEIAFESIDRLKQQMAEDIKLARSYYFGSN